jgi:hypothetical protein
MALRTVWTCQTVTGNPPETATMSSPGMAATAATSVMMTVCQGLAGDLLLPCVHGSWAPRLLDQAILIMVLFGCVSVP